MLLNPVYLVSGVIIMMIGKTVRLPVVKKMSKIEKSFYNSLITGLGKQLNVAFDYLKSSEYKKVNKKIDEDNFEDLLIYDELTVLLNNNPMDNQKYINNFYDNGKRLAFKQLNIKSSPVNKYDVVCLSNLMDYEMDLIYDLNKELAIGIKNVLCDNDNVNDTRKNLLELLYVPIISNFSVDSRAEMISRTEHSRGVNTGTLQTYSNNNVGEVDIITSGMSNVCDDCLLLEENNPYTLEEASRLIPLHPLCNCSYRPIKNSGVDDDVMIVDLT